MHQLGYVFIGDRVEGILNKPCLDFALAGIHMEGYIKLPAKGKPSNCENPNVSGFILCSLNSRQLINSSCLEIFPFIICYFVSPWKFSGKSNVLTKILRTNTVNGRESHKWIHVFSLEPPLSIWKASFSCLYPIPVYLCLFWVHGKGLKNFRLHGKLGTPLTRLLPFSASCFQFLSPEPSLS